MKFQYQYKSSNGERHSGICCASSKDAVFAQLRKTGIKPFSVTLAPGFFNWICSFGRRGLIIAILVLVCAVLACSVLWSLRASHDAMATVRDTFDSPIRRQIIGDDAVIDHAIRSGWSEVFHLKGEQFLASYAVPGVVGGVTDCSPEELKVAIASESPTMDGASCDNIESRQILAIVGGMKEEARTFVADGGSYALYISRVSRRQQEEAGYYSRAKAELETVAKGGDMQALTELWERRNAELRKLGLRTLLFPSVKENNVR